MSAEHKEKPDIFPFPPVIYLVPLLIGLVGITISVNTVWPLLFVPVVLVLISLVIRQEERYLEGKFGQEYSNYKANVRRWL